MSSSGRSIVWFCSVPAAHLGPRAPWFPRPQPPAAKGTPGPTRPLLPSPLSRGRLLHRIL